MPTDTMNDQQLNDVLTDPKFYSLSQGDQHYVLSQHPAFVSVSPEEMDGFISKSKSRVIITPNQPTPKPAADTGRLSLGDPKTGKFDGTSISANPSFLSRIRSGSDVKANGTNIHIPGLEALPAAAETAGGIIGGGGPAITGSPEFSPQGAVAGSAFGRGIGESVNKFVMGLMRPKWMDSPSIKDELLDTGKKMAQSAAGAASGIVLGKVGSDLVAGESAIRDPEMLFRGKKLVQALNITDEPRAAAQRAAQGIQDIQSSYLANAKVAGDGSSASAIPGTTALTGINSSASLETHAARAVQEFQARIDKFMPKHVLRSLTFPTQPFIQEVAESIPSTASATERQAIMNSIPSILDKQSITGEELLDLIHKWNAEDSVYHSLTPADRMRADLQSKYIVNESLANHGRNQLYPEVADVSGPGVKELMRRQGNVIMVRNAAHITANSEFINPPAGAVARGVKHAIGIASGKPLPVVNGIIDFSKADFNPSSMIKDIFSTSFIPESKYPTPNPPSPPVDLGTDVWTGPKAASQMAPTVKPEGEQNFTPAWGNELRLNGEPPASPEWSNRPPVAETPILKGSPKQNTTFSPQDLEEFRKERMSQAPTVVDKRGVPVRAGETNRPAISEPPSMSKVVDKRPQAFQDEMADKLKRQQQSDTFQQETVPQLAGVKPFRPQYDEAVVRGLSKEQKLLAPPPNFIIKGESSEVSPSRFISGTEQTGRSAKQIADTVTVGATKSGPVSLDKAMEQWASNGLSEGTVVSNASKHLPAGVDAQKFVSDWVRERTMRLPPSYRPLKIEQTKNVWESWVNMLRDLGTRK